MKFPKQKIGYSARTDEFYKNSIDALIEATGFSRKEHQEAWRMYQYYSGSIPDSEYKYVTNPYASKHGGGKDYKYPAKVRNFNILKPTLTLLVGENSKRPRNTTVVAKNAESVTAYEEYVSQHSYNNAVGMFINELNNLGMPVAPEQETQPPEHLEKWALANFVEKRAMMGQEALNYILAFNEWEEQVQLGVFDWLVAGETYSYKYIQNGEVYREVVSPLELDYDRGNGHTYLEDNNSCVRRRMMQLPDILERFGDIITEEQLDKLEAMQYGDYTGDFLGGMFGPQGLSGGPATFTSGDSGNRIMHEFPVYHAVWQGMKKVYVLGYLDPMTGAWEEQMYDEDEWPGDKEIEKVMKEMEVAVHDIETMWVNEVLEGFRIDKDIYLGMQPCEYQRISKRNPSRNKLPYNGRRFSDRHTENTSLCKDGIAYQLLYNIFHFRLELTMAKNKGKIALFEVNSIPKKHGWDEEKFMWTMDAAGYAFIDSTAENARGNRIDFQHFKVLDMDLGNYINKQFEMLASIKENWEEYVGINRHRKGQTTSSDGVGTSQQSLYQSSLITEEHFRRYDHFLKTDLQGLLDLSQHAWPDGKKQFFLRSDGSRGVLNISKEEFSDFNEADFGVFVFNSGKEVEILEQLKQHGQAFAQNGYSASTIGKILASDNFSSLMKDLELAERKVAESQQAAAEAEKAGLMEVEQFKQELEYAKLEHESTENHMDRIHELNMAGMEGGEEAAGPTGDEGRDAVNREKIAADQEKARTQAILEMNKMRQEAQLRMEELKVKREENATKLKIAKENKNKHDTKVKAKSSK